MRKPASLPAERLPVRQEAAGSSPVAPATIWGMLCRGSFGKNLRAENLRGTVTTNGGSLVRRERVRRRYSA
jgi:hypothetical protein